MYEKISVLVPTRGRVERLRRMIESFDQTTQGCNAELIFRVDDDDSATRDFLRGSRHYINGPRLGGYDSMPTFFNELAQAALGDVLMCGNDDMIFKTPGWPTLILEQANRFLDGLFNIGVSTHNEDHFPFSVVSRKVVDKLGFIWDPSIFWGDIYLRDVMSWYGRAVHLPTVEIVHDWAGFKPDATFDEADKDIVRRRPGYWAEVHAPAVAAAAAKLKEMYA